LLLRSKAGLAGWSRTWQFGRGSLLLQACKLGLGVFARLEGGVQFRAGCSGLCARLHKFLKQVGANPVQPGNLVLRRLSSYGRPTAAKSNRRHSDKADRAPSFFVQ
jgi:hypothetical protein